MYDDFDDLEETRRGARRAYVSSMSQHDADRLLRENERLKKSLEKEKFFNRLLDQELKDVKEEAADRTPDYARNIRPGVSKGAFYTLFIISLVMAGFIAYTLYYNKQYNLFNGAQFSLTPTPAAQESAPAGDGLPEGSGGANGAGDASASGAAADGARPGSAGNGNTATPVMTAANTATVRDSVPNIIGAAGPSAASRQPTAASQAEEEYDEAAVEALLAGLPPESPETSRQVITPTPVTPPPPPVVNRPVIGRYHVSSKANFYDSPDENTLRNVFIAQGGNKIVSALEDRNGFIYVEYKNDRGYTTRGWLSKKDLTKAE